MHVMKL